ncbi:MAG TPA: hypothetical protein VKA73_07975 [Rubrobacter sp.]|nr:hypothetical protein [Rubrobacter sp.]
MGITQRLTTGVGLVSLVLGVAMMLDPRGSAALLGWADREGLSRVVGATDLALGAGLLLGRRRARWMLARSLLNAAIGLVYVRVLAEGRPRRGRAGAGAGLMAALTVFDYSLSRRLRRAETP